MFQKLLEPYFERSSQRSYKRGNIIYHEGDAPESLYLVQSGLVGLFHISESGKETFLRVFGVGSIFGHRSYFAGEPYHATTVALEKTEVIVIPNSLCQDMCNENTALLKEVSKLMARSLGAAELRLAGLQDKTAPNRIAESLVYLKLKYPNHTWTRKEIAEYSASTFETVTRVMTKLDELGLIEKDGRDFLIKDPQELLNFERNHSS